MKKEYQSLAAHRLQLAKQTLEDAQLLAKADRLRSAVNRAYYAAFYAVRAVLATKRLDSRKHSGVLSLFDTHFVLEDKFSRDIGRKFHELFEARMTSDYRDLVQLETNQVNSLVEAASEIVQYVELYLKEFLSAGK